MKRFWLSLLLLLTPILVWANGNPLDSVEDTLHVGLRVDSEGVFYNAEFSHPMKPGYTLPGVAVEPTLRVQPNKWAEFIGGYRGVFMGGKMRSVVGCPVISLRMCLSPELMIRMGTLANTRTHGLPDWLYSHQWPWLHNPETGAKIKYMRGLFRAETWIDWSNFIWRGENDNERFLYGLRVQYGGSRRPEVVLTGMRVGLFALASHIGGQIDDSPEPVQTSLNAGVDLHYTSSPMGGLSLRLLGGVYFAISRDGAAASPLDISSGWAGYPYLALRMRRGMVSVGYFRAKRFVSLRGEELLSAYSSWGDGRAMAARSVLTGTLRYRYQLGKSTEFTARAEGFYDLTLSRVDWAFLLRIRMRLSHWFV